MQSAAMLALVPHPAHPPLAVRSVEADILFPQSGPMSGMAMVRYRVDGIGALVLPAFSGRGRQEELWQTTCFELFAAGPGTAYREFNFATSGRWAVYDFDARRSGMREFNPTTMPEITAQSGDRLLAVTATISARDLLGGEQAMFDRAGLTVVLQEEGGVKSYWALAHGNDRPDFHDPACFTARLAAPART